MKSELQRMLTFLGLMFLGIALLSFLTRGAFLGIVVALIGAGMLAVVWAIDPNRK